MIALVTGGREYRNRVELYNVMDWLHGNRKLTFVVHGAARGADTLAHKWALSRGVQPVAMAALWDAQGDAAGSKRNATMLAFSDPDIVVAFSGGRGTSNMMRLAYEKKNKGREIEIIDVEDLPESLRNAA